MTLLRRMALMYVVLLLPVLASAELGGDVPVSFQEVDVYFPDAEAWTYHYFCRYPRLLGNNPSAENINRYYETAISEMTELVLPMYANDPDMAAYGQNGFLQEYEITCNNGAFFSTRMLQKQTLGDSAFETVHSQVFAIRGPYAGESLTLRGLLGEIGESSTQIAAVVLNDIWKRIESEMAAGGAVWLEDLTFDMFALDFYPEEHFYADNDGNAVFYLQPGLFRRDPEISVFTYSKDDVTALLNETTLQEVR